MNCGYFITSFGETELILVLRPIPNCSGRLPRCTATRSSNAAGRVPPDTNQNLLPPPRDNFLVKQFQKLTNTSDGYHFRLFSKKIRS